MAHFDYGMKSPALTISFIWTSERFGETEVDLHDLALNQFQDFCGDRMVSLVNQPLYSFDRPSTMTRVSTHINYQQALRIAAVILEANGCRACDRNTRTQYRYSIQSYVYLAQSSYIEIAPIVAQPNEAFEMDEALRNGGSRKVAMLHIGRWMDVRTLDCDLNQD